MSMVMAFFASGRLIVTVATQPSIARSMLIFHHSALLRRSGGATRHTRSKAAPKHRLLEFWPVPNCAGSALETRFTGRSEEHTSELESILRSSYAALFVQK